MQVGALEIQIYAEMARLSSDMKRAEGLVSGSMAKISSAVGGAMRALGGLGLGMSVAGIVAMVKNLNDGVDALNDLRDATGATIENISALESVAKRTGANFGTVSTALIKYNQALGTTIKPGGDAEKVLKALGLNAKELRDLDPAEALRQTAVALNQFADDGNKARAVQDLFGRSLKEVAPFLKDLAESGKLNATVTKQQAEESEKFNKELYKMSAALQDVGRAIANPLVVGLNSLIDYFKNAAKEGESLIVTLLKLASPSALLKQALGLTPDKTNGFTDARKGIENINAALKDTSLREGERNAMLAQRVRLQAQLAGYLNSTAGAGRGVGGYGDLPKGSLVLPPDEPVIKKAAAVKAAADHSIQEARRVAEERQKLRIKEYDDIEKFFQHVAELERQQIAANLKAYLEMQRLREDSDRDAESDIAKRVAALDLEGKNYGRLQSAIEETTLARMRDALEGAYLGGEDIESLNRRIELQQRLVDGLKGRELREANENAAREASTAWSHVGESFVDNLMRGGKSVAQYLKDLFRTLVLRPLLQPVGQAISGVLGGVMGNGAATTGAVQGGIGSIGNLAGSLFGSGGLAGSMMAGAGWMTGATTFTGALTAATSLMGTGTAAGIMSGLGMVAGALGPIAIGVMALMSFIKSGGGPKQDGRFGTTYTGIGATDNSLAAAVQPAVQGLQAQYDAMAKAFGSTAAITFGLAISRDPKGTSPTFLEIAGTKNGQQLFSNLNRTVGRSDEDLTQALKVATTDALLGALKASDLEQPFADFFGKVAADASTESKDAAIKVASDVLSFSQPLKDLGGVFAQLAILSVEARAGMIEAAGGLQALAQATSTYYENFYSAEEQRVITISRIGRAFAEVGLSLDGIDLSSSNARQQFRAMVDSLDLATAAGEKQFTTLMSVSGAFASVTEAAEAASGAVNAVSDVMKGLLVEKDNVLIALKRAQGDEVGANAHQRALDILTNSYTAAEIEIYDYNNAIRDQIDVVTAAAQIQIEHQNLANSLTKAGVSLEIQLARARGDMVAVRRMETVGYNDAEIALYDHNAAIQAEIDVLTNATNTVTGATNQLTTAYNNEKKAIESTRDRMAGFVTQFTMFRDNLLLGDLSPLTPGQKYMEARSQFEQVVADVKSGDLAKATAASEKFDSVAQTFLTASREYYASSDQYTRDFQMVLGYTQQGIDLSQSNYDTAVDSLAQLKAMVSGLITVDEDVISVRDAIAALGNLAPTGSTSAVSDLYQRLLGRAPDQEGAAYWGARAAQGTTETQLAASIAASPEFIDRINSIYQELLGRNVDESGLAYRQAQAAAGATEADVYAQIQASPEYQAKNYITDAYQNLLGRTPDPEGMSYWSAQSLQPSDLYMAIMNSPEFKNRMNEALSLGRETEIYNAFKWAGVSLGTANQIMGWPVGSAEELARLLGLPVFHQGTDFVQNTGFALLERGEAVTSRSSNFMGGGNASAVIARLETIAAKVDALIGRVQDLTEQHADGTRAVVDANDRAATKIVSGSSRSRFELEQADGAKAR